MRHISYYLTGYLNPEAYMPKKKAETSPQVERAKQIAEMLDNLDAIMSRKRITDLERR